METPHRRSSVFTIDLPNFSIDKSRQYKQPQYRPLFIIYTFSPRLIFSAFQDDSGATGTRTRWNRNNGVVAETRLKKRNKDMPWNYILSTSAWMAK
ncbi:unnamed protein product [Lactuca virosa]|uniref:Uncharacterized protein n=1 Tax=Lactuca virosa TaxID=75947 RepID=A0AAU9LPI2_9ASTR|nr:unnamed protein product [Lactuca virosa]